MKPKKKNSARRTPQPLLSVGQLSRITKELILNLPPTNTSMEAMEVRRDIEADLIQMRQDGIMPDLPYDFDFDDTPPPAAPPAAPTIDDQLALPQEGLTIDAIRDHLTFDERMWFNQMLGEYGEAHMLKMWPSYQVQLNYVRNF